MTNPIKISATITSGSVSIITIAATNSANITIKNAIASMLLLVSSLLLLVLS